MKKIYLVLFVLFCAMTAGAQIAPIELKPIDNSLVPKMSGNQTGSRDGTHANIFKGLSSNFAE